MDVYLDMDGVLCQLVPELLDYHGITVERWPKGVYDLRIVTGRDDIFDVPASLWERLMPGSHFVDLMGRFPDARICTHALAGTEVHKQSWLSSWGYDKEIIFIREKWLLAQPGRLLIDDYEVNCNKWREQGGQAFCWPQRWNYGVEEHKLAQLERYIDEHCL